MRQKAFFDAVVAGDAVALRRLAGEDPSLVHARNEYNRTALHVALEDNNTVCDVLIELGCPIDVCAAASLGRLDALRAMLDDDPALANDESTGLSPLGWASYFCAEDAARLLLERGADPRDGALLCAASVNCARVGRLLIDAGADPDAIDGDAQANALHAAATLQHTRDATAFAEMLLERGADVNATTPHGYTALDVVDRCRARRREDGTLRHHDYDAMERLLVARGGIRKQGD